MKQRKQMSQEELDYIRDIATRRRKVKLTTELIQEVTQAANERMERLPILKK